MSAGDDRLHVEQMKAADEKARQELQAARDHLIARGELPPVNPLGDKSERCPKCGRFGECIRRVYPLAGREEFFLDGWAYPLEEWGCPVCDRAAFEAARRWGTAS